jgi:HSP20 family molecular chaperone IbpA
MQDEAEQDEQDGGELRRVSSNDSDVQNHDVPLFILNERKVGAFERTFTLPIDVDMKELKSTLQDGLLRIDLPKRNMSGEPRMKIEAE